MLTKLLIVSYAVAWPVSAVYGADALAVVAALLTLPIFLVAFIRRLLWGTAIYVILTVISLICPPLTFLIAGWAILSVILKFLRLARNLLPIAAGCILYGLLFAAASVNAAGPRHPVLVTLCVVALAGIGALAIHGALAVFERLRYERTWSAALMLGFPVYLVMFLSTLLLPGAHDESLDHHDLKI